MYDPSGLYVDPILSNMSVGFSDQQLFGLRLFPQTPVNTPSGRYRVYDRSDWLIYPSLRAPKTVANEVEGKKWSEDTFKTVEHALQSAIGDEEYRELHSLGGFADPVFGGDLDLDPARDALDLINRSLELEHEQKVANTIRNTANYPGPNVLPLATTFQWSDYTGGTSSDSDPVGNLRVAQQTIYKACGRWANTLIIPFDGVGVIENHPRVVERFKYTSLSSPDAWKVLMGLPAEASTELNVFVVDSKFNAADNIDAAEDVQSFWGQDAWLGIVDQAPGHKTKTFGKTFSQLYTGGSTRPTERWREEGRKSDLVRVNWKYDLKVVSSAAGFLFTTAFAAV